MDMTLTSAMPWPRTQVGITFSTVQYSTVQYSTTGRHHLHRELEADIHGVGREESPQQEDRQLGNPVICSGNMKVDIKYQYFGRFRATTNVYISYLALEYALDKKGTVRIL